LELPGELAKHGEFCTRPKIYVFNDECQSAVSEGTKAVTKFNSAQGTKGSQSIKAGLIFPVSRVKAMLKKCKYTVTASFAILYCTRYQRTAYRYHCCGVFVCRMRVLDRRDIGTRGQCFKRYVIFAYRIHQLTTPLYLIDLKVQRITPRHVCLAVRGDEELDRFLQHAVIRAGGVIPHIHKSLIKGKSSSATFDTPTPFGGPFTFGAPATTGFGAQTTSFGSNPITSAFTFGGSNQIPSFGAPTTTSSSNVGNVFSFPSNNPTFLN